MKVLAIDPGYDRVGFAVLEKQPPRRAETVHYSNCFVTVRSHAFVERLRAVGEEMERLINETEPDVCAIEKLYFSSNQKTAMAVSEARGVFLYVATQHALPVFEYTPLEIKSAVTGDGHSDKRQIIAMIPKLVVINKTIRHDDEYDAIAIGITCLAREGSAWEKRV